jgi:hypothetical protein
VQDSTGSAAAGAGERSGSQAVGFAAGAGDGAATGVSGAGVTTPLIEAFFFLLLVPRAFRVARS